MVDLKAQYNSIKTEIDHAISHTIQNSQFILGPEVKALEEEMAAYLGIKYAVGVASGTEAIQLALIACGIGPCDEVITTPFTFISTAETIVQCGARPVFVDIDPRSYNIDPQQLEEALRRTSKNQPKAILPVHLYGQAANMDPILNLARKYNLKVIEDCAQALGAIYHHGTSSSSANSSKAGTMGDAGCLSFFPSKVLGAYGDGGMVVTDNTELADRVRMLRNHGCKQKYYHRIPGFNSRLDGLQAAILRVKLKHLSKWIEQRRQKAALYTELLGEIDGVEPPYVAPYSYHIFNYYTIRLTKPSIDRGKLQEYLGSTGIATAIYYPLSLHLQEVYEALGYKPGDFPESEKAQEEVLSLPIYPELSQQQIQNIVGAIRDFIAGN